jgi:hypothetical protein
MIFVESVADERKVRLNIPDVLSLVSYQCRLFQRDKEDMFANSNPLSPQPLDTRSAQSALLSGTIHEVRADDAICWLEISSGVQVKFSVPLTLLAHLEAKPGLELLWSPGKEGDLPIFWKREPEPPDADLIREVKARYQRIRNTLKNWQPHAPEDE